MAGVLDILNHVKGDINISFDVNNPNEVQEAEQTVNQLLQKGYTIIVRHEGQDHKVTKFDATKCCYIAKHNDIPLENSQATAFAPVVGG